jgi:hypothetical protein
MFIDLGTAIAKGIQGYYKGQDDKTKLDQEKQLFELSKQLKQTQLQGEQLNNQYTQQVIPYQVKAMQNKVQQLEDNYIKDKVNNALYEYQKTSDPDIFNKVLMHYPQIRQLVGNPSRIDKINEQDKQVLANQLGLKDPKSINDFRFVKVTNPDGSQYYFDLATIYGMTGYHTWATTQTSKDLQNKLNEIKVNNGGALPTAKEVLIPEYTDLATKIQNGTAKPEEIIRFKALKSYLGLDKHYLQQQEATEKTFDILHTLPKVVTDPKKLDETINNPDLMKQALEYQNTNKIKMSDKVKGELQGTLKTIYHTDQIINRIQNNKDFNQDALTHLRQGLESFITSDMFKKMSPEERQKYIDRLQVNSEVGLLIKDYVRAISGLQVTDREYELLKNFVAGSDWSNKQSLLAHLVQFQKYIKGSAIKDIQTYSAQYPYDTLITIAPYKDDLFTNFKYNVKENKIENPAIRKDKVDELLKKL